METVELKRCPFCGNKARLEHSRVQLTNSDYADICVSWKVVCTYCGVSKDGGTTCYQFKSDETLEIEQKAFSNGRASAISKWNRRTGENNERN